MQSDRSDYIWKSHLHVKNVTGKVKEQAVKKSQNTH